MSLKEDAPEPYKISGVITKIESEAIYITAPEERMVAVSERVSVIASGSEISLEDLSVGDKVNIYSLSDPYQKNPFDEKNRIQAKVIEVMK